MQNKKTFKVTVDGKELEIAVVRPNHKVNQMAALIYNKEHRRAVENGSPVRAKIESLLRDQGLWDDVKQAKLKELMTRLFDDEKVLAKGGIKLADARDKAIRMRRTRLEIQELEARRREFDATTAEAFAEQGKFNYLVSQCTLDAKDGKHYYRDVDDYLGRDGDPVAYQAAQALASLLYNLDDDFESKLPEVKFLKMYKYVDNSLHLIDKQGRKIDEKGRLVDDQERLINEQGQLIDADGNLLTESGDYKLDFIPFLDDDGTPVEAVTV